MNLGVCCCPAGTNGSFCKHQAYLHKNLNISFINAPAVTRKERLSMGKLALGEECPKDDWFMDLAEIKEPILNLTIEKQSTVKGENQQTIELPIQVPRASKIEECEQREAANLQITHELTRLKTLSNELPSNLLEKFAKKLKHIQSAQQLYLFTDLASKTSKLKAKSKIKVPHSYFSKKARRN